MLIKSNVANGEVNIFECYLATEMFVSTIVEKRDTNTGVLELYVSEIETLLGLFGWDYDGEVIDEYSEY